MQPKSTNISEHFMWADLASAEDIKRLTPSQVTALRNVAWYVLEPLYKMYPGRVTVSSGFRNAQHNARVSGATHSQHIAGEAVDVVISDVDNHLDIADAVRTALRPFKFGAYKSHLHIGIPSHDLVFHAKPAYWSKA